MEELSPDCIGAMSQAVKIQDDSGPTMIVRCDNVMTCENTNEVPLKSLSKEEICQAQEDDMDIRVIIKHLQSSSRLGSKQ